MIFSGQQLRCEKKETKGVLLLEKQFFIIIRDDHRFPLLVFVDCMSFITIYTSWQSKSSCGKRGRDEIPFSFSQSLPPSPKIPSSFLHCYQEEVSQAAKHFFACNLLLVVLLSLSFSLSLSLSHFKESEDGNKRRYFQKKRW